MGFNAGTENGEEGKITFGPLGGVPGAKGIPLLRLKRWSIRTKSQVTSWGDSSSLGFENSEPGRRSCMGDVTAVYDINLAPINDEMSRFFREGDIFPMQLWLGDVAGFYWDFPQVIISDGPTYEVDVEAMTILEYSFQFSSIGPFFHPFDTKTIHNPDLDQPADVAYPATRIFS